MRRGVDMTTKDNEGLTPLDMAKKSESKECVQLIQKSQEPEETANNEDKSPNEDELVVEVHESSNTPPSDHQEENKSQDTSEQHKADDSVEEKLEDKAPTPKKKKRISFLLPGEQEPVPIDNEFKQEQCKDIIPQDDETILMMENVEPAETAAVTVTDSDAQLPEPIVSRHQVMHIHSYNTWQLV
jgi:hypothetical protein